LDLLDDRLDIVFVEPGFPAEVVKRPPQRTPEIIEYHLADVGTPTGKVLFVGPRASDGVPPASTTGQSVVLYRRY